MRDFRIIVKMIETEVSFGNIKYGVIIKGKGREVNKAY